MLGNGSLRVAQGDVIKNIVELFTGNSVCDIPSHMSFWYFTLATWCFIIRAEHIQFCCPTSFPQMGTGLWSPDGVMERLVLWVSQVWQQLNACLSRLGTHEALLGPQLFLSCPVVPNNAQAIVRCVNMSLSRKKLVCFQCSFVKWRSYAIWIKAEALHCWLFDLYRGTVPLLVRVV